MTTRGADSPPADGDDRRRRAADGVSEVPKSADNSRARELFLRPATEGDAGAIARLRACRTGRAVEQYLAGGHTTLKWAEEAPRSRLILVAEKRDQVVAYGAAGLFEPPVGAPDECAPRGWYLMGLIVLPGYRRKGIGSILVARRLAWISERSHQAWAIVRRNNWGSIALLRSFGFELEAQNVWHPKLGQAGDSRILMRVELACSDR